MSGTVTIAGTAGTGWSNLRAYNSAGAPVSSDAAPAGGSYALTVDTTKLVNGTNALSVSAFSVPPAKPEALRPQ